MPEPGTFADDEFMKSLQIVLASEVHIGHALMTDHAGEPLVGNSVVLDLEHRRNQDRTTEPVLTRFGLNAESAVQVCGQLLVAIDVAYGTDVVRELLAGAAAVARSIDAEENDD